MKMGNIKKMVKKHEKENKKVKGTMYYLTDYNTKTKKFKGKKMTMIEYSKQLKKDINEKQFLKEGRAILAKLKKNKKKGQYGGAWMTARFFINFVNITLGVSAIYIVCTGSAAQTTIVAGFTALINGQCSNFAELTFGYMGLGNPICTLWQNIWINVIRAVGGDPIAIAKITGVIVLTMKAPQWIPRLHGNAVKKLANICQLGGLMSTEEFQRLEVMYQNFSESNESNELDDLDNEGPEIHVVNENVLDNGRGY